MDSAEPSVLVPAERPFDEQATTAHVVAENLPAVLVGDTAGTAWDDVVRRAAALDGNDWEGWCDGRAVDRFATIVEELLDTSVRRDEACRSPWSRWHGGGTRTWRSRNAACAWRCRTIGSWWRWTIPTW
ncbi:hypothetical protein [Nocardioides yefusunii]|uniref:Uncharacterized protein n=1 Tax=Nocardioides yefusunii TaxID=2500546 RepID=A0ABW1QUF9_9ACTN|nr:hypothetical protein [Nocardioides yefusunii]